VVRVRKGLAKVWCGVVAEHGAASHLAVPPVDLQAYDCSAIGLRTLLTCKPLAEAKPWSVMFRMCVHTPVTMQAVLLPVDVAALWQQHSR
jgi:hypothetical protein